MNKLLQFMIDRGNVSHKVLPTYQNRGEVIPRATGDMMTGVRKPIIKLSAEEAKRIQMQNMAQQAIAKQASVRPASKPTDRQAVLEKNRQYAASTGKRFNPNSGAVTPYFSDNTDRTLNRAWDNIVNPMLNIEMAISGAGLAGQGIKAVGSNAYRINPWAYKQDPTKLYRGIGEQGMQDVIEQGVFRGKPNVERVNFPNTNINASKSFGNTTYWSPKLETASTYGEGIVAEIPTDAAKFLQKYRKTDWSKFTNETIPLDKARLLKKHWLMGYKEVPTVYTDIRKMTPSNLSKYVDLSSDVSGGTGVHNLGVYPMKRDSRVLFKVGFENKRNPIIEADYVPEDMVSLTKDLDPRFFAKTYKNIGLNPKQAKLFNQAGNRKMQYFNSGRENYNLSGDVVSRVEGRNLEQLSAEDIVDIPEAAYQKYIDDIANLDSKGIAYDVYGDNFVYDQGVQRFKMFDLASKRGVSPMQFNAYPLREVVDGNKSVMQLDKAKIKEHLNQKMRGRFLNDINSDAKMGTYGTEDIENMFQGIYDKIKNTRKAGGPIVDPRGQWAHPGRDTIIPTPNGRITMQDVPYPVYGQDETGYGQMMYPGKEYKFPGQMVYEKPMMQKGGMAAYNKKYPPIYVDNPKDPRIGKYAEAGNQYLYRPAAKQTTQPTPADSLRIYNMQLAQNAYYNKFKDAFEKPEITPYYDDVYNNPAISSIYIGNNPSQSLVTYRGAIKDAQANPDFWLRRIRNYHNVDNKQAMQMIGNSLAGTKSYNTDPNIIYYKDLITPQIDPAAPFSIYDKRIKPQGVIYRKPKVTVDFPGEQVETFYYDPIAVKPFSMRTPKEQQEFERKYGKPKPRTASKPVAKPVQKTTQPTIQEVYKEQISQPVQQPVALPPRNIYEGSPVYTPGSGAGIQSALVGFRSDRGDTTYIKPEDYDRLAVPKYAQDYIQSLMKKQRGGQYIDSVLNANKALNWVQRLYEKNPKSMMVPGQTEPSTHFMESGNGRVYPTVVQMPDGSLQYLGDDAYDYADSTKTYIQFPSDRKAKWFGKNYKKGTGVLSGYEQGGSLPKYQTEGWVKRAADANLNFWEKCGLSQSANNGVLGGGRMMDLTDIQKQMWKERTDLYAGLSGKDKKAMRAQYAAAAAKNPGLTEEMYGMALRDASDVTGGMNTYGKYIGADGRIPDDVVVPNFYKFFINNKLVPTNKPVTVDDMIQMYNSMPGGFDEGYKKLFIDGYVPKKESGGQHGGLDRWFAEKWVDIKTGKECGRDEGEKRKGYPACRPSRRVSEDTPKTSSELSSEEREKFKRSKTSSERINYQHRRKEYGGEQTETDMANKPNNPALWSRAKSLAKQKFDVYPSAYANGWAAKWYKGKGGTWSKAMYGMEVPMMAEGGKPEWLLEAQLKAQGYSGDALQQKMASMAEGGEPQNKGFQALPEYVQDKIMGMAYGGGYMPEMMAYGGAAQQAAIAIAMKKAGKKPKSMQKGGEPDGEMALGQIAAVVDKMDKLRQFIQPGSDLEPWISSKLSVMDHYADAVSDYMMYNPEAQEMQEEMPEMGSGGYTVTRSNDRKGKTHKVTGPDGTVKYFGDAKLGQHPRDPERKKAFYARHKKNLDRNPYFRAFARATWQDGGEPAPYKPLSQEELSALAHQYRGTGSDNVGAYTLPYKIQFDPIKNTLGHLTPREREQLLNYMDSRSGMQKIWELMPNLRGNSGAAGLPKNSRLRDSMREDFLGSYPKWLGYMQSQGYKQGGYVGYDGKMHQSKTPTWSGNAGYEMGGYIPEAMYGMGMAMGGAPCYECGGGVYKEGGISIDPKNKGKFTASAKKAGMGVQAFANKVLQNKEDYSSTMVKRANFARNAAKWNKQEGGPVVGDVLQDVTPEQMEMLRAQGYDFEII